MGRPHRIDQPGMIHHVFNRGVDRQRIFFADADRKEFGRLLGEIHDLFGVEILAYCLLDNHFHLVVRCPDGHLSDAMKHLGSVFVLHTNDRVGRDGPMFRGRFRSIPVLDEGYLLVAVRYVHRNALDVTGVHVVEAYRWSSHRAYLGLRPAPTFLTTAPILSRFGDDPARFHRFVVRRDLPRGFPVTVEALAAVFDLQVAVQAADDDVKAERWLIRTAILASLDLLPPDLAAATRASLGDPSTRALQRARKRLTEDPVVRRIVASALRQLGLDAAAAEATLCA